MATPISVIVAVLVTAPVMVSGFAMAIGNPDC